MADLKIKFDVVKHRSCPPHLPPTEERITKLMGGDDDVKLFFLDFANAFFHQP